MRFIPEGRPNHWIDEAGHLVVARDGQTPDEVVADLDKGVVSPTAEERLDAVFPQTDSARVIFEALFEQANEIRALKGQGAVSRLQYRDWLKAKLPA